MSTPEELTTMCDNFDDVLSANRAYASDFNLTGLSGHAARHLAVLTCIDSRIEPLEMLGIGPGDAKILRNAGARVSEDALRSLVLAVNLLDVERIMVVAHTRCAMSSMSPAELGEQLEQRYPGSGATKTDFGVMADQLDTLESDVALIREHPMIPRETIIGGFRYDVDTGLIEPIVVV